MNKKSIIAGIIIGAVLMFTGIMGWQLRNLATTVVQTRADVDQIILLIQQSQKK